MSNSKQWFYDKKVPELMLGVSVGVGRWGSGGEEGGRDNYI